MGNKFDLMSDGKNQDCSGHFATEHVIVFQNKCQATWKVLNAKTISITFNSKILFEFVDKTCTEAILIHPIETPPGKMIVSYDM